MMGRRRKSRHDLPERMYFKHGSHYFLDAANKWHNLGRDYVKAMTAYAQLNQPDTLGNRVGTLLDGYLDTLRELVRQGKRSERYLEDTLRQVKTLRAFFGRMRPADVTPQVVYQYVDERGAPVAANRDLAVLSNAFKWGIRKGLCSDNPCRLVQRHTETPRDREVLDAEFIAVRGIAAPVIQCAMNVIDQVGLRLGDVLRLNDREHRPMPLRELMSYHKAREAFDLTEAEYQVAKGVVILTGKRKKRLLFLWTTELEALRAECRRLPRDGVSSPYWICTRDGQKYTEDGFKSIWQRVIRPAYEAGLVAERFTLQDLRSRAGDRAKDATNLLAHDDPKTTNRIYKRRPRAVRSNPPTV